MKKCLIALTALIPAAVLAVPVWTWVDERGQRHYSDREVAGAEQLEIGGTSTFSGDALRVRSPTTAGQTGSDGAQTALPYAVFDIVSPRPEETLRNVIGGDLSLEIATSPALRTAHRIDVIVDGERRNLNLRSLSITVPEVFRGEHTLQALIIDSSGAVLMQSAPVRFFVQQVGLNSPARQ
jgi:Domain of unknown function (DUF4124)